MENFRFCSPTQILFGKGMIKDLPKVLRTYGNNVLLTYGGGSIKKNGIYDEVTKLLCDNNFNVFELGGIEPNPRIESVCAGVEICKKENIDVILAVGGGSTIDCSKVIGAGAHYNNDPWDIVMDASLITKVTPIVAVLTLAATGSEMNRNAVISDLGKNMKIGVGHENMIPRTSILDPTYLFTVPTMHIAAGASDIMSHIIESYFKKEEAFVQDGISEALLKTVIRYAPIALENPKDYDAQANLMWASSLALNGLVGSGKPGVWTCHPIEHQLSAYYDITHGVGLAILTIRWMRYILSDKTVDKFAGYATNVWGLQASDKYELANKGIDETEKFFKALKLPMTLKEVGIDESKFAEMAKRCVKQNDMEHAYVPLNEEDIVNILKACK